MQPLSGAVLSNQRCIFTIVDFVSLVLTNIGTVFFQIKSVPEFGVLTLVFAELIFEINETDFTEKTNEKHDQITDVCDSRFYEVFLVGCCFLFEMVHTFINSSW